MVTLAQLAEEVQSQVAVIDSYLKENDLPQPTFDVDSPRELPHDPNVQRARMLLIEKASALANLATGAADHLLWQQMIDKYDGTALHFLAAFNIFDAVPKEGSISYAELSEKVGVPEHRLGRILAQAYTQHYFYPPKPGFVAHTSNSAVASGNPTGRAWIFHNMEEAQPWYGNKLVETTRRWGDSYNPLHTGPNLHVKPGEEKSFFQIIQEDDSGEWNGVQGKGFRLARLYDSERGFANSGTTNGKGLLPAFDWGKLGKGKVVMIDGYTGHLLSAVALAHPDLTFIIQTKFSPGYEERFYEKLAPELKGRVTCMAHNQYQDDQPVKGADIYFMSTSLQKENDESGSNIIRRIVDAMDSEKSRILIRDIVIDGGDPLPDKTTSNGNGTPSKKEGEYDAGLGPTGFITRFNTGTDLQMMCVMNSFQRTRAEWVSLFKKADPRLELKRCIQPVGNCTALMEFALEE